MTILLSGALAIFNQVVVDISSFNSVQSLLVTNFGSSTVSIVLTTVEVPPSHIVAALNSKCKIIDAENNGV